MRGIYEGLMLYQTLFVVVLFRILQGMGFHDLKVSFLILGYICIYALFQSSFRDTKCDIQIIPHE